MRDQMEAQRSASIACTVRQDSSRERMYWNNPDENGQESCKVHLSILTDPGL